MRWLLTVPAEVRVEPTETRLATTETLTPAEARREPTEAQLAATETLTPAEARREPTEAATGAEEAATGAEEAAAGAEEATSTQAATGAEKAASAEAAMDKPARPPDRPNEQFAVTSAVFVQEPEEPGEPAELREPEEPGEPAELKEPGEPGEPAELKEPEEPGEPAELKEPEKPGEPAGLKEPEKPGEPAELKEPGGPAELKEPEEPGEPAGPKEPVELKKPEEPEEDPGWDEWPPEGNNRSLSSRKDRPRRHGTVNAVEEDAATALLEEEARENCEPEPRRIVLNPESIAPRGRSTRAIHAKQAVVEELRRMRRAREGGTAAEADTVGVRRKAERFAEDAKMDPSNCLMKTLVLRENQEGVRIRRSPGDYTKHLPWVLGRVFPQTLCGPSDDKQGRCASSDVQGNGGRCVSGNAPGSRNQ